MLMLTEQECSHASWLDFQFDHICSCFFPSSRLESEDEQSDKRNKHQKTKLYTKQSLTSKEDL